MQVNLHYSPDADDAFMFWALKTGKVDSENYEFVHHRADTESLNALASNAAPQAKLPDVCAISIHQYAYIDKHYLLLPHGGSVGQNYGPLLVTKSPQALSALQGRRIGIPGLRTTAYLVLRMLLSDFEPVIIPIAPFSAVFEALAEGQIDAALLIHEGRLLYERNQLHPVIDVGEAWHDLTGLPLPLGGNAIRRGIGSAHIANISRILKQSIEWGLAHREELLHALLQSEERSDVRLNVDILDRYIAMYANNDTLDYGTQGRQAIKELFRRAHSLQLLPSTVQVEFAP